MRGRTPDNSARAMLDETYHRPQPDAPIDDPTCTICHPGPAVPAPSHLVTIDGDMIREVARIQHDKTIQAIVDRVTAMPDQKRDEHAYGFKDRSAPDFKREVLAVLRELRDQA